MLRDIWSSLAYLYAHVGFVPQRFLSGARRHFRIACNLMCNSFGQTRKVAFVTPLACVGKMGSLIELLCQGWIR